MSNKLKTTRFNIHDSRRFLYAQTKKILDTRNVPLLSQFPTTSSDTSAFLICEQTYLYFTQKEPYNFPSSYDKCVNSALNHNRFTFV